jgi:hypothetical protein
MTRYPDEATTVPETGMIVSLAYPDAAAVVYRLRAELSRPGRVSPLPAFSRTRRFASLKLNVTGNVKDAPEATVLGRDELPHWKVPRLMVQPVTVTAVFAVQVTWVVDICVTSTDPKTIGFGVQVNGWVKVWPPPPIALMTLAALTYTRPFPKTARVYLVNGPVAAPGGRVIEAKTPLTGTALYAKSPLLVSEIQTIPVPACPLLLVTVGGLNPANVIAVLPANVNTGLPEVSCPNFQAYK